MFNISLKMLPVKCGGTETQSSLKYKVQNCKKVSNLSKFTDSLVPSGQDQITICRVTLRVSRFEL